MTTHTAIEPLPLPVAVHRLRALTPPGGRVLSVYLDTSPDRQAREAIRIAFQDGCKALRVNLPAAEREGFEAARQQVEHYLTAIFVPHHPGLALFATGSAEYFSVVPLPQTTADDLVWAAEPHLEPLEAVIDDAERVAVVLCDKERALLWTVYLGAIEEHHRIVDEVPGKQATGGWFGLAQTRYARHHEDHVRRHIKRTIRRLVEIHQRHPFDRLMIGGPPEALVVLRQDLPRQMRTRLAGTLHLELFASDADVLAAVREMAMTTERQTESALVDELIDAAETPHAVLDFQPTLAALSAGRVHRLFLANTFMGEGGECPQCMRLVAGPGDCPACHVPTQPVEDLRERIIDRARAQGAKIEIVSGEAAARLMLANGLGAWTRY